MTNSRTSVLISGASIAGPALALCLSRYGFDVTVVERAPALRPGGQAIDFKGATQRTVLDRIGILDDVVARQTGGTDQTIINAAGRPLAVIPGEFTGGDIEILRGDLAALLYERSVSGCEYVFGDSIASLTDTGDGVTVTFEVGAPRRFDLVIGADGIHSNTRRLVAGPESDHVVFLEHYYALVGLDVTDPPVMYNEPGRMVALGGPKSPAFFVFASDRKGMERLDPVRQKEFLCSAYAGGGWRVPELISRVTAADEFYLDSLSRVVIDRYAFGRVALLGDSAWGNTLGGFGSGLGVVGAYILAGELASAGGDHTVAFGRYERLMRPYAKVARRGSAGPFLAPGNRLRMKLRDWTFKSDTMLRMMLKATDKFATDVDLPDYSMPQRRG